MKEYWENKELLEIILRLGKNSSSIRVKIWASKKLNKAMPFLRAKYRGEK